VYVLTPGEGGGEPCIITSTGAIDLIADDPDVWVSDVRRYGFFSLDRDESAELDACDRRIAEMMEAEDHRDPVDALVRAIKERGLESGRIGIDEIGILPDCWDRLA